MSAKHKSPAANFLNSNAANKMLTELRGNIKEMTLHTRLRDKLPKILIDDDEFYVAEGDTLLDEAQLEVYALQKEATYLLREFNSLSDAAGLGNVGLNGDNNRGLLGMTQGGKIVRWKPGKVLTYCVLKKTFVTGNENYEMVRNNFLQATNDWENTCGIKFGYKLELDNTNDTDPSDLGVVFVVRELDAGGRFIASAFFPNDPVYRRRVLIDPTYYRSNGFDKVGVLRHEIGHVLGFRHEHIRASAPDPCYNEDLTDVVDLTAYDSKSVMHYLCGGAGDPQLKITSSDRDGAQKLYGPPINDVTFVA